MIPLHSAPAYNIGMGIRFFCPNGHKLNVKAFLAGKRGICPHCGAKVRIPTQSTLERESESSDPSENSAVAESNDTAATEPPTAGDLLPPNESDGVASTETKGDAAAGVDIPISEQSIPPELPQAKPLPNDLLDETPDAVWFVRVSDGGQFGPAGAEAMRQWMEEGRIGGDCLVWREGWTDWRDALETFPALRGESAPSIRAGGVPPSRWKSDGVARVGDSVSSARSRSTMFREVAITVLLLMALVGSAILVWVLSQ